MEKVIAAKASSKGDLINFASPRAQRFSNLTYVII